MSKDEKTAAEVERLLHVLAVELDDVINEHKGPYTTIVVTEDKSHFFIFPIEVDDLPAKLAMHGVCKEHCDDIAKESSDLLLARKGTPVIVCTENALSLVLATPESRNHAYFIN